MSSIWFCLLGLCALAFLSLGRWLGEQPKTTALPTLIASVLLILLAAIPRFKPTLLHTTFPLGLTIYLEGILATFPWMLMVGILWSGRAFRRLHRAAILMIVLGFVYFLFGGVWMILPDVRPYERETRTKQGVTLQSRPDTCVPAACATALRRIGVPTTEAEMCHVVMAKPGRGSTLARAAYGLSHRLAHLAVTVSLRDLDLDQVLALASPSRPVLVVIRSNIAADHMVVVLGREPRGVIIANPSPGDHGRVRKLPIKTNFGFEVFAPDDFARLYRGGAIVFEHGPPQLTPPRQTP